MNKNSIPPLLPRLLNNIYIILVRPSHPANIGAVARAMKTMGLSKLIIVEPRLMATPMTPEPLRFDADIPFQLPEESYVLASGAKDILQQVSFNSSLQDAIADINLTCALSSRKREISAKLQTPRAIMPEVIQTAQHNAKVAFVFGSETFGLSIEEVQQCNRLITINGNPNYFSLNLAQAVQVIGYELFSQLDISMQHLDAKSSLATREQVSGMLDHFAQTMQQIGFFDRRNKTRLLRRIQRLFDKAQIEPEEIDIIRGFLSTINKISSKQ